MTSIVVSLLGIGLVGGLSVPIQESFSQGEIGCDPVDDPVNCTPAEPLACDPTVDPSCVPPAEACDPTDPDCESIAMPSLLLKHTMH